MGKEIIQIENIDFLKNVNLNFKTTLKLIQYYKLKNKYNTK